MNPLFARELRARWRDPRSWLLALVLALTLSGLAYTSFLTGTTRPEESRPVWNGTTYIYKTPVISPVARAARAGRELFQTLALGNLAAWMLIAPLAAATPIARERERGLLESLQLSQMSARSQIAARYGATVTFLLWLQALIAPIYAAVFWLGGVAPWEFGLAGALITASALGGVALGLWISSRAPRPSGALFVALATVVVWTLAAVIGGAVALSPGATWWFWPGSALFWTHPLPLLYILTDAGGQLASYALPPGLLDLSDCIWWSCALWSLLSAAFLVLATRHVARALPAPAWGNRASAPVRWWRASLQKRQARVERQRAKALHRVEGVLMADLPIERFANFSDALLQREVRARFRLRRGSWPIMLGRLLLFAAGVCIWLSALYNLNDPVQRGGAAAALLYGIWVLGALSVGGLAASSFARERESGTWEGLHLSLLRPIEIVRAKLFSPLIAFAYYAVPLWGLLPLSVNWFGRAGVSALTLFLASAVVALTLITTCALGLIVSWRARGPSAALGVTLALLAALWIGVPMAREVTDFDEQVSQMLFGVTLDRYDYAPGGQVDLAAVNRQVANQQRAINFRRFYSLTHPKVAISHALDPGHNNSRNTLSPWMALWVQLGVCALVTGGGAGWLCRQIARDREG